MPWFRVDDGFWSHPKTLQLSDGAVALWLRAGSWSMHHLTDGHIPDHALRILAAKPRHVDELRNVSLWFSTEDGNQFHDWEKYQPTREQVEADRHAAAERKRKSREKSHRESRVTDGGVTEGVTPTPTQPTPSHSSSTKKRTTTASRGTRLDPSWTPPAEEVAKARGYAPHVDLKAEHDVFVDYWIGVPGARGSKSDWLATWRNWMRRKEGDTKVSSATRQTAAAKNLATVGYFEAQERMELES